MDITAAFLQSENIDRDVYIRPPKDIKKRGVLWKLIKPVYGLGDSARLWYQTLKKHLISQGCKMSKLDKTVFRYYVNGKLSGLIVTHVDDLLYSGDTGFHQTVIKSILTTFKISRQHTGNFKYLRLNVQQDRDIGKITVDQIDYANSIKRVPISKSRAKAKEEELTAEESSSYQKVLGKLLWMSGRTRPDLSYDTMELSMYAKSPQVKHLINLNKVVKKLDFGINQLVFNRLNLAKEGYNVSFFSDSSRGNLPDRVSSGRGYITFLCNQSGYANILNWSANKIKRVAHSAFAAETLACVDAIAAAIYTRQLLSEVLLDDARSHLIPIYGYVDNMQLFEQVTSTKQSSDKRIRLDMAELQETVETGEVEDISWIPTDKMLADCLTKKDAGIENLAEVLETGFSPIFQRN